MNNTHKILRHTTLAACLCIAAAAWAGPGAHGPNGEHLDGPAGHSHSVASTAPRMETKSEDFELVATLAEDELSILIDRFATNEPVLGAQVEVQTGQVKAVAKFHADHGDYAVADEAFLKALASPGEHALVVTISTGKESDLLDGVLKVEAASAEHAHGVPRWAWAGGVVLLLLGAGAVALRSIRRRTALGSAA
ncbi:hypothetical protein LRS03_08955 [Rhizobacter sp. J219]|uniref:hypothetical protein n=1 Tax=Rhizobacter sp. J219 TaxID=2898430 RepID=UPI0021510D6C|nr:hypothetical protein [Rhizobacter sp. J219]MCR5882977.1 hypothetical protein [Rhizobacter sp. J219]